MKKHIITLSLVLLSSSAFAQNVIGVDMGYGGQNVDLKQGSTSGDEFNFDAYYRYMLSDFVGAEAGWTSAAGGIGSFLVDQVSEIKDIYFSGPNAKLFLQYPFSKNNAIYTKLGVNNYKVDYKVDDVNKDETDIGYEAAIGLETRFNWGLGFNVEYRYLDNSIISANQVMVGASYRF